MSGKILLADIGNTSCKIGFATKAGLLATYSLPSTGPQSADTLGLLLLRLLEYQGCAPPDLDNCVVCSVVPELEPVFAEACRKYLQHVPLTFPGDFKLNMENRYQNAAEVGADRLLAAYAARRLYPEPVSLISIDYGTATTFDCVTGNAYLGGLIAPGVLSSHAALARDTAKLPRIALEVRDDEPLIGRTTATSLKHGFVFGFAAMSEGLCERLRQQLPGPVEIVATGGFAADIARVWPGLHHLRPDLILEGLRQVWLNSLN